MDEETIEGLPQPGEVIVGKYQLVRVIGQGGMGAVMEAKHVHLQTSVAIKFLLPSGKPNKMRAVRFAREARIGATLKSDHVVRVTDTGVHNDVVPYMVMEMLSGHDLSGPAERGDLPANVVATYLVQTCEALAEAHVNGVVHRDLKPANLFAVQRPDGKPHIKVLDFGISKMADEMGVHGDITKTAALMGSPLYMPPERLRSAKEADPRGDIWALGSILYELLTGTTAFEGDTLPVVCSNILGRDPRDMAAFAQSQGPVFEHVVRRCLEKDKDKRYNNVSELAADLAPVALPDASDAVTRMRRVLGVVNTPINTLQGIGKGAAAGAPAAEAANALTSSQQLGATVSVDGPAAPGVAQAVGSAPLPSVASAASAAVPATQQGPYTPGVPPAHAHGAPAHHGGPTAGYAPAASHAQPGQLQPGSHSHSAAAATGHVAATAQLGGAQPVASGVGHASRPGGDTQVSAPHPAQPAGQHPAPVGYMTAPASAVATSIDSTSMPLREEKSGNGRTLIALLGGLALVAVGVGAFLLRDGQPTDAPQGANAAAKVTTSAAAPAISATANAAASVTASATAGPAPSASLSAAASASAVVAAPVPVRTARPGALPRPNPRPPVVAPPSPNGDSLFDDRK